MLEISSDMDLVSHFAPNHKMCTLMISTGFLPLAQLPILRLLGGDQFRKFCVVSTIILVVTVWITCWTQEETARESRRVEKQCVFFNPCY